MRRDVDRFFSVSVSLCVFLRLRDVVLSVDIVRVFASGRDGDVSFGATACSCRSVLPG